MPKAKMVRAVHFRHSMNEVFKPKLFARETTHRSVLVSILADCAETLLLALAAWKSGSVALGAQTAANLAGVAVSGFLLVGLLSGAREPDDMHPLGYGRKRFIWSLFATLGILVGGGGISIAAAIHSAIHPSPVTSYPLAYSILLATIAIDVIALRVALPPLRKEALIRKVTLRAHLRRSSDTAAITVLVSTACAVICGLIAGLGLVASELTGNSAPDTFSSALVGLLLLVASAMLLHNNLDLLTGRSVPTAVLAQMRLVIEAQPGVVSVPDLFVVVVGPSSLILDGDVTFEKDLTVAALEQAVAGAAIALKTQWPTLEYVYLTPVAKLRSRRMQRTSRVETKKA